MLTVIMNDLAGRCSKPGALLLLVFLVAQCADRALADPLDDAIKTYDRGKYRDSLAILQTISPGNKTEGKVHYYKALNFQCLNQIAQAQKEYTWVYTHSDDNRLRYNAAVALQRIQRYSQRRAYQGQGNTFSRSGSMRSGRT